ncbi:MAG TPA: DUF6624 domain-containing protein, partial [Vicinamibacteria bacterium]|nr:DUF6624 domain-containing protein [Vicinamibacteria bacterium]
VAASMSSNPEWEAIRAELLTMSREDQDVREELARDGSLSDGYHPRMEEIHRRNGERLKRIVNARGWPGVSRVGPEAAEAAWLIVQHGIAAPDLMRRGLAAVTEAVPRGEASPLHRAMLEDRIRSFEGRGQRFGTQFDWDAEGELSPLPLEDPAGVDARRGEIGLPPLAADLRRRREAIASSTERPPADWERRREMLEEWLRKVGWRR